MIQWIFRFVGRVFGYYFVELFDEVIDKLIQSVYEVYFVVSDEDIVCGSNIVWFYVYVVYFVKDFLVVLVISYCVDWFEDNLVDLNGCIGEVGEVDVDIF